jgi:redox-sensing transcriptional repressor
VGYNVSGLKKSVGKILGVDKCWPAVLIGAGNLGSALVNYGGFNKMGMEITNILDVDLNKIGNNIGPITVQSMKQLDQVIEEDDVKLGVITVPGDAAQEVATQLVEAGIKAIWNFAPTRLYVPDDVVVRNEDLAVGIVSLIYHLSWQENIDQES